MIKISSWELELVQQLIKRLIGVVVAEGEYSWDWKPEEGGIFLLIKSCYLVLEMLWLLKEGITLEEEVVFRYLWRRREYHLVSTFYTDFIQRQLWKQRFIRETK
jgi:hypothetical protein